MTAYRCLPHWPHSSARLMPLRATWFDRISSEIRHRNALSKIAWEDTGQGLGMTMSTVASEKNLTFIGNVFYKQ